MMLLTVQDSRRIVAALIFGQIGGLPKGNR